MGETTRDYLRAIRDPQTVHAMLKIMLKTTGRVERATPRNARADGPFQ